MGIANLIASDISRLRVTTSWDDGHPADLRLEDLLAKHEAIGTFYILYINAEGRPVMQRAEIRLLGQHLKIGGHTRDHVSLTQSASDAAAQQIIVNKKWLEDLLGREVICFACMRGHHNRTIRRLVRNAGFRYARTVANLSHAPGLERYQTPTTVQFFPHTDDNYVRNYLSGGASWRRMALLRAVLKKHGLLDQLCWAAELCGRRGGCFRIWEHSWELNEYDLRDMLDRVLAYLRQLSTHFVTNGASWTRALAFNTAVTELVL